MGVKNWLLCLILVLLSSWEAFAGDKPTIEDVAFELVATSEENAPFRATEIDKVVVNEEGELRISYYANIDLWDTKNTHPSKTFSFRREEWDFKTYVVGNKAMLLINALDARSGVSLELEVFEIDGDLKAKAISFKGLKSSKLSLRYADQNNRPLGIRSLHIFRQRKNRAIVSTYTPNARSNFKSLRKLITSSVGLCERQLL